MEDDRYTRVDRFLSDCSLRPLGASMPATVASPRWWASLEEEGASRFLGVLSPSMMVDLLDAMGVLAHWQALGYASLSVRINTASRQRQRLIIAPGFDPEGEPLLELWVLREYLRVELGEASLRERWWPVLTIDHLRAQRPGQAFSADRPQLPGQRHPGSLGIVRGLLSLFLAWARMIGAAAITALPEFLHSGLLFAEQMQCVSPRMGGFISDVVEQLLPPPQTLAAARRAAVAQVSWAFERGEVKDAEGQVVRWPTEMMARALGGPLDELLTGAAHARAIEACRGRFRLSVDRHVDGLI